MTAREVLRLATRGGAAVLGRDDIGILAPGMAADFAGVRLDSLALAGGAVHDPLASLVFCRPRQRRLHASSTACRSSSTARSSTLDVERLSRAAQRIRARARQLTSARLALRQIAASTRSGVIGMS